MFTVTPVRALLLVLPLVLPSALMARRLLQIQAGHRLQVSVGDQVVLLLLAAAAAVVAVVVAVVWVWVTVLALPLAAVAVVTG